MKQAEKGKQGELLCANILASGGWLCFFPENKFASQADIKAVHCVSDEVKRIEVKTQTPYAFKKMLSIFSSFPQSVISHIEYPLYSGLKDE